MNRQCSRPGLGQKTLKTPDSLEAHAISIFKPVLKEQPAYIGLEPKLGLEGVGDE